MDAIPSADLRALVESCIVRHLDPDALELTRKIEEEERQTLQLIATRAA